MCLATIYAAASAAAPGGHRYTSTSGAAPPDTPDPRTARRLSDEHTTRPRPREESGYRPRDTSSSGFDFMTTVALGMAGVGAMAGLCD